jgi:hypothetical protein
MHPPLTKRDLAAKGGRGNGSWRGAFGVWPLETVLRGKLGRLLDNREGARSNHRSGETMPESEGFPKANGEAGPGTDARNALTPAGTAALARPLAGDRPGAALQHPDARTPTGSGAGNTFSRPDGGASTRGTDN